MRENQNMFFFFFFFFFFFILCACVMDPRGCFLLTGTAKYPKIAFPSKQDSATCRRHVLVSKCRNWCF